MPTYIVAPIETDPPALAELAFAYLEASIPGWVAHPGNLDVLLIEAISEQAAEQAEIASGVTTGIFRYFGQLVGIPADEGTFATADPTFTLVDTLGHTIPAGTVVGLRDADNELRGFRSVSDVVVPAGPSTAVVSVVADDEGTVANGLSGVAELVDVPEFVTAVNFSAPTGGGVDEETDDTYLNRLAEQLTLLSPRPILPDDFAIMARGVAGVGRAAAVDGLKPGPPWDGAAEATGQERMVTVAITDTAGNAPSAGLRTTVDALLQAEREQSFTVWVVAPNYQNVDVVTTATAWPSYDVADVDTRVTAAISDFLSPLTWGTGPVPDPRVWYDDSVVRIGELFQAINAVEGVRFVNSITVGPQGGPLNPTDYDMQPASALPILPRPGTGIAVTILPS